MPPQYHGVREDQFTANVLTHFNNMNDELGGLHIVSVGSYLATVPEDEPALIAYGNATNNTSGMQDHTLSDTIGNVYDMYAFDATGGGEPFALPGRRTHVGETAAMRVYSYVGLYRGQLSYFTEEQLTAIIDTPLRACVDDDYVEAANARLDAAARESIIALSRQTFQSGITTRRQRIALRERTLVDLGQQITDNLTQMRRDATELDLLVSQQDSDDGGRLADEYEALKSHPRVAQVRFIGEQIVITTTRDIILHDFDAGVERWLGAFRLSVNIANQRVSITNLDTPRGGRQHPHVSGTDPCFGGHEMEFAQLMSQGEILVLFELLVNYLESYNKHDSWGRYGSYWFDEADQRPTEAATAVA